MPTRRCRSRSFRVDAMTDPAASVAGVAKRFGATLALDGVDFDVARRNPRDRRRERRRQIDADPHPGRGPSPRPRRHPDRRRGAAVLQPARRHRSRHRHHPAGIAAGAGAVDRGEYRARRPAGAAARPAGAARPRAHARGCADRARPARLRPRSGRPVDALGFAERQLVAIAKALRRRCRIFILDEPTAALEQREIERLFAVLARMKRRARRSSTSPIASTRWSRSPTAAPCCATDGSPRSARAARSPCRSGGGDDRTLATEVVAGAAPRRAPARGAPDGVATLRLRAGEVIGLAGLLGSGADRMLRRLFGVADEPTAVTVGAGERRLASPATPSPPASAWCRASARSASS